IYPDIEVRLRLSDHDVDLMREGIDIAYRLGILEDSSLHMPGIMECERVLAAAPAYLARRGEPQTPQELVSRKHDCLMLRCPGTGEFFWVLKSPEGPSTFDVHGPFDPDDDDVLTGWALVGRGILNKPRFEIEKLIRDGQLQVILAETPPVPVQLAVLYPHKK